MTRRKTKHAADSSFALRDEKILYIRSCIRSAGKKRRKIIVEDKHILEFGVYSARRAFVARAHVARRMVLRNIRRRSFFHSSLPRTIGAVRGNEDPLLQKRIEAAMWMLCEVEIHLSSKANYKISSAPAPAEQTKTSGVIPVADL